MQPVREGASSEGVRGGPNLSAWMESSLEGMQLWQAEWIGIVRVLLRTGPGNRKEKMADKAVLNFRI